MPDPEPFNTNVNRPPLRPRQPQAQALRRNNNRAWLLGIVAVLFLTVGWIIWGTIAGSTSSAPASSSSTQNPVIYKTMNEEVNSVAWSPDGKYLASGGYGVPVVEVWEVSTGKKVLTYNGHKGDRVDSLAWSPDGQYIASGDLYGTVQVWNARSGETAVSYNCGSTVHTLAWSPDGTSVACSGDDVQIFNVATGQQTLTFGNFIVNALVWSPDGKTIAVAIYFTPEVQFWDANTGQQEFTYKTDSETRSLAWSPDGNSIACGGYDDVQIWNISTGEAIATYKASGEAVAWSPDGKYLAIASDTSFSSSLEVQDVLSEKQVVAHDMDAATYTLAWSPDGKYLASGLRDGTIEIWSMQLS